jgi:hypothetical protein
MNKLIKLLGCVAALGLCVVATTKANYWSQQYLHDLNLTESTDYVEASSGASLYGNIYHSNAPYSSARLTARPLDQWGQPGEYVLHLFAGLDGSMEGGAWYQSAATFEVKAQSTFTWYGGYANYNISISW